METHAQQAGTEYAARRREQRCEIVDYGIPTSHRSNAFVARERELVELRAGLLDACNGRGRFFLISGEPGIGKTRLADELAKCAEAQGMCVLRAGCAEDAGAPAYWPFIQIIGAAISGRRRDAPPEQDAGNVADAVRDLAPLIQQLQPPSASLTGALPQPPPNPEQVRFSLFNSVAAALRKVAAITPLLLILEDLHDADHPSLMMLRFVAAQLKDARVVMVGTCRNVAVQRSAALSQLIGELIREGVELPLAALSREDAARMVEGWAGAPLSPRLVSDIYQASCGNPLFIGGLLRVLASGGEVTSAGRLNLIAIKVPHDVREAIRRWLNLLAARSRLAVAALIGQEFDLRCLQRVTGLDAAQLKDELAEASRAGIVTMLAQGGYRFSHTLIRKVLCDELNSADRSALHLKIGEAFEELYQADAGAHAAVLAHHFREGGDIDRAIHYSIRAGEAARRMFAYEEAVAHWRYALELMAHRAHGREGRAGQVEWLSGRGPASIIAGDGTASALQGNAHPPPTSQNASATESARAAVFRREGDYWTLSWAGLETRLRHRKGMQHIARLLRYPGEEIAADMLAAVPLAANGSKAAVTEAAYQTGVSVVRGLGNCGAPLDSVAKAQYRRRLHDLRSELEEAQNLNDLGRAGKVREQIEFIEAKVCASLGLRGRDRMQVSHTERARLAVTKAIKVALTRIRQVHPELGRHLAVSIQTGYFCAYMSAQPVNWQL